ncbi:anthranilate synthase component II [Alteromonas gilva]|uniref:Aminodeoxychorismate/anthranilate synthase component II n=1 Tax=Alteromonas gilva TaxID=2987522 RepID=A0ABT5L4Z2_9ALTE|nr:aminodeoxychorismate/anthranilate synthase component II [Alteromonas gilva]MDC8832109.1 aminodeoxychorismate/anthranilate synthase component II [Alteromonas gilva]
MLLLIDNYDSFSHNLARYFTELGCELSVVRNDAIRPEDIDPAVVEGIVISPGPCTPDEAGVSLAVIKQFAGLIPIFGVCLGHQAIGQAFGASVVGAARIRHGKVSAVQHTGDPLFHNIPETFAVTRYHSLVIAPESLPDCLMALAWTHDGQQQELMALRHRTLPIWGVQYHPESLLTEYGHQILDNFLQLARVRRQPGGVPGVLMANKLAGSPELL